MEENSDTGLTEHGNSDNRTDHDLIDQIHRELARLDLPCDCKEELDRTIVAIETWHTLKRRRELSRHIKADYEQLVSGISFLTDLGEVHQRELNAQEMRDHSESLKFLADLADRCARRLSELSMISDQDQQQP